MWPVDPKLGYPFVRAALAQLRTRHDWVIGWGAMEALLAVAPDEVAGVLSRIAPELDYDNFVFGTWVRGHDLERAAAFYRAALARRSVIFSLTAVLIRDLGQQKPALATAVWQSMLDRIDFQRLSPVETWGLEVCVELGATATPRQSRAALSRLLDALTNPEYGAKADTVMTTRFRIGQEIVETTTRESLLVAAAVRLGEKLPDEISRRADLFRPWYSMLSGLPPGSAEMLGFQFQPAAEAEEPGSGIPSLSQRLRALAKASDTPNKERTARELAAAIDQPPPGKRRLLLAGELCRISPASIREMSAQTLYRAIRDGHPVTRAALQTAGYGDDYLQLAGLLRDGGFTIEEAGNDHSLAAAAELLTLRALAESRTDLRFRVLNGQSFSLRELRGRVVVLSFWATWCVPCREEMAGLEQIYRRQKERGLELLAVSDEPPATIAGFLKQQTGLSFPFVLDPDRRAFTAYSLEGVPRAFVLAEDGHVIGGAGNLNQLAGLLERAGLK